MPFVVVDGQTIRRPGVPSTERVVSTLPGAAPSFRLPVLMAYAEKGPPYDVRSKGETGEGPRGPFEIALTNAVVGDTFGRDSDMYEAFVWAKRGGLPMCWCLNLSPSTRASIIATSGGGTPVNEAKVWAREFGLLGNYILVKYASNTLELTPPRYYAKLAANVTAGDTRIFVTDTTWMRPGMDITLVSSSATAETVTISDDWTFEAGQTYTADGRRSYYVDLDTGTSGAFTMAAFGMVVHHDAVDTVTQAAITDGDEMVAYLQDESTILNCTPQGTFSAAKWDDVTPAAMLKDIGPWGAVTVGTAPAATVTDVGNIFDDLDAEEWDNFVIDEGNAPQAFCLVTADSASHQSARDWAITKRSINEPVSFTFGTEWGDTDLAASDDTNPRVRAAALNSQDCCLAAGGIDETPAYLSFAPYVWGLRLSGELNHNITNDNLVYNTLEVRWDERGTREISRLLQAGVVCYGLRGNRFRVEQGLNTLQANDNAWNEGTDDTCLIAQRDVVDAIVADVRQHLLTTQSGADIVTEASIGDELRDRLDYWLNDRKLISGWVINSITLGATANSYDVDWGLRPQPTIDFIPLTTNILVGDE